MKGIGNFDLTTNIKSIQRGIDQAEREVLTQVGKHMQGKIRAKIKRDQISLPGEPPGKDSGNLIKGIGYQVDIKNHEVASGPGPPAYHAHLLELGTEVRTVGKTGKDAGQVLARPFIIPTFEEEKENIKLILAGEWDI